MSVAKVGFIKASNIDWSFLPDSEKDLNTFYYIYDVNKLFLGKTELTNSVIGNLASLNTKNKSSIVAAINELKSSLDTQIVESISQLVAGAPEQFDTLKEIADYILASKDIEKQVAENAKNIADILSKIDNLPILDNTITREEFNKTIQDERLKSELAYDTIGAATRARSEAKAYTDKSLEWIEF